MSSRKLILELTRAEADALKNATSYCTVDGEEMYPHPATRAAALRAHDKLWELLYGKENHQCLTFAHS